MNVLYIYTQISERILIVGRRNKGIKKTGTKGRLSLYTSLFLNYVPNTTIIYSKNN